MKHEQNPMLHGPHDIQIEQEVLGCVLIHNQAHRFIEDILRPEHFFEPLHQELFDICAKLITAGKSATPSTVKSFLPNDFEVVEGMKISQYLARLAASATTIISVRDFAIIIRDLADYRSIVGIVEMAATVKGIDSDPSKAATAAIEMLDAIVAERTVGQVPSLSLGQSVVRTVDAAAKAYQTDGAMTGLSYGLRDLDIKTSGLQRGELTILAGRPGMFKTGLVLNTSRRMCQAGHFGIFFSHEMGDVSLSRRMLSDVIFDEYELPHFKIKSGRFTEKDFEYVRNAALRLNEVENNLRIEQQSGLTVAQMAARARQMRRRGKLDFMVVDHIGHVGTDDRYRGNRNNELGQITKGLLQLAKELDIGMVALCQLNRGVETRENKKPHLGDLRESGQIEEDAATVLFVYREGYYLANAEPKPESPEYSIWQDKMIACWNNLDIIVGKQRDGATGAVQAFVDVRCNAVRDHGWTREAWIAAPADDRFAF